MPTIDRTQEAPERAGRPEERDGPGALLLEPGELGPYVLRNRVLMAPMTRNRADQNGVPTEMMTTYYRQRASAGLIVTEATQISRQGQGYPMTPGIHTDEQAEAWSGIVEAVHREGGKIFVQLFHGGRVSHPDFQPGGERPVAPSSVAPDGEAMTYEGPKEFVEPRALSEDDIAEVVADYADAARYALEAGFDGIELHGANGYLIDQFIRDGSNRRDDGYGGSAENRARFLREVVEAVTGVVGPRRVGVRISPLNPFNSMSDSAPQETFETVAGSLAGRDLAYLHVVEDGKDAFDGDFDFQAIGEAFGGTYVANGGYDRERGAEALATDLADFVAYGRLFLANPDLPRRFALDAPLNEPDPDTFYGGDEEGYIDYPALDEE